jgi:hypothetical protein
MSRSRRNQEKSKHRQNSENLEVSHLRTPRDLESISTRVTFFLTANPHEGTGIAKLMREPSCEQTLSF